MSRKTKGRVGWYQATPKTSKSICNFTGLATRIKAIIVTLVLWGLLPFAAAGWLINREGLRDE